MFLPHVFHPVIQAEPLVDFLWRVYVRLIYSPPSTTSPGGFSSCMLERSLTGVSAANVACR